MTFQELKEKPFARTAFEEFTTVKSFKEKLYKHNLDWIPNTCKCGSDIIISREGTSALCCDPRCIIKMGYQITHIFKNYNCKEIGDAFGASIAKRLPEGRLLDYFTLGINHPFGDYRGEVYVNSTREMLEKRETIGSLISNLGIPILANKAERVFRGCNNIQDFAGKVKRLDNIPNLFSSFGINDFKTYFFFAEFLPDIIDFIKYKEDFITKSSTKIWSICVSGNLVYNGSPISESVYIEHLNELAVDESGFKHFDIRVDRSMHSNDILVCMPHNVSKQTSVFKDRERELNTKLIGGKHVTLDKFDANYIPLIATPDEFATFIVSITRPEWMPDEEGEVLMNEF